MKTFTWSLLNTWKNVDKSTIENILSKAFNSWTNYIDVIFFHERNYDKAEIKIGFYSKNHNCSENFDGEKGTLAHASSIKYNPENLIIHFDADEDWIMDCSNNTIDYMFNLKPSFYNVAVHEIGHILGLLHNSDPTSVMYDSNRNLITKPIESDIRILSELYSIKDTYKLKPYNNIYKITSVIILLAFLIIIYKKM